MLRGLVPTHVGAKLSHVSRTRLALLPTRLATFAASTCAGRAPRRHAAPSIRLAPARGSRPSSSARGLRFSQVLVRLSQGRDVELLLGDQPLAPRLLDFELLEPLRLLRLYAAALVAPAVEGLLAHAEVLEHLRHRAARREHGVGLATLVDDLLRGVSCPFHRESPGPSRGRSGLS